MTRTRGLLLVGLLLALVLAGGVSYYASTSPDGLDKVSADEGFADRAAEHGLADSPVADYGVRGVSDDRLSGGLAGILGVLVTFAVGGAVFAVVRRSAPRNAAPGNTAPDDAAPAHAAAGSGSTGSSSAGSGSTGPEPTAGP